MSPTAMVVLILVAAVVILGMVLDVLFFKKLFHRLQARYWFLLSVIILFVGNRFVALITKENLNQAVLSVIPSIILFVVAGITIAVGFTRLMPWNPGSKAK